jgi:aromatic ring-cleaving dioxygenase
MREAGYRRIVMTEQDAPYHAHLYYVPETRAVAEATRLRLIERMESGDIPQLLFVGQLKDGKAGPHPIPQFEIHYTKAALPSVLRLIEESGLTALVAPPHGRRPGRSHQPGPLDRNSDRTRSKHARSARQEPGRRAFREVGFLSAEHAEMSLRRLSA